jgi:hypothetical protein
MTEEIISKRILQYNQEEISADEDWKLSKSVGEEAKTCNPAYTKKW